MSKRNRRGGRRTRSRRQRREEREDLERFVEALSGDLGPLGISLDQALQMARDGAEKMARRMARSGAATRAPWGHIVYDQAALEKTLQTGLLMMARGTEEIGARGDVPDLSDAEAACMLFHAIGGAVTAAAAGILWLASQPIPYEMARHLTAQENPVE